MKYVVMRKVMIMNDSVMVKLLVMKTIVTISLKLNWKTVQHTKEEHLFHGIGDQSLLWPKYRTVIL